MKRYLAVISSDHGNGIYDCLPNRTAGGKYHPRVEYKNTEVHNTVEWLNERENGYPTVLMFDVDPLYTNFNRNRN